MHSKTKVYIVGVGMTKFVKPGSVPDWDYPDMVNDAVAEALQDSDLKYTDIEQALVSYVFGQTCSGQRALYPLGMTGIPIYNVNNACASGSSALNLARQIILAGVSNCVLVVGFEKMKSGSLDDASAVDSNSVHPLDKHFQVIADTFGFEAAPMTAQMFGNAAREHMEKYGTKLEHFAKIAFKNHKHSVHNKRSQFRKQYSLQEIIDSKMIHSPLTKLQCCPTSDGSAAVVLCSENFLTSRPRLRSTAVEIVGMTMATDLRSTFDEKSNLKMVGFDVTHKAAKQLYDETGISPDQIQLIELHDCFSANELITYEALGLCPIGKAGDLIDRDDNTYGGKWVVNPSGGLISKGHPLGATGVAQCAELCWQLRRLAGQRQVPNANIALQHNIGIGGAVVLGLYKLAYPTNDAPTTTMSLPGVSFRSDVIFERISKQPVEQMQRLVKDVKAIFAFTVSKGTHVKKFVVDLTQIPVVVFTSDQQDRKNSDCEVFINDDDLMGVFAGKLKPEFLFTAGKLKIKGDFSKAIKLRTIFQSVSVPSRL